MRITKPTRLSGIKRNWHIFDTGDKILGRVAVEIASVLMGKDKPQYVPNLDCGDYAVVINVSKVRVSGKKAKQKMYFKFSGYPGGLKKKSFEKVLQENPKRIIIQAVAGMLPKNKLKASMLKRLFIFEDEKHTFEDKFKA